MKVPLQRRNECMLSTIAAISGKPLTKIRARALELADKPKWEDTTTVQYWFVVEKLRKEFKLGSSIPKRKDFKAGNKRRKLPPTGRGSITTESKIVDDSHIEPFEDGIIYSTKCTCCSWTIDEHRALMKDYGAKITGIWY